MNDEFTEILGEFNDLWWETNADSDVLAMYELAGALGDRDRIDLLYLALMKMVASSAGAVAASRNWDYGSGQEFIDGVLEGAHGVYKSSFDTYKALEASGLTPH